MDENRGKSVIGRSVQRLLCIKVQVRDGAERLEGKAGCKQCFEWKIDLVYWGQRVGDQEEKESWVTSRFGWEAGCWHESQACERVRRHVDPLGIRRDKGLRGKSTGAGAKLKQN